ncbi:MAG: VCBS repeat-containing protein [Rhodopirellula sp.]|nr:VCBS repeat-containing protein [Rhodopirellula sp.]
MAEDANATTGSLRRRGRRVIVGLFMLLMASGVIFFVWNSQRSAARLIDRAALAFRRHDYELSERLARQVLSRAPESTKAKLLVGRSLAAQRKFSEALIQFAHVPNDGSAEAVTARCEGGDILLTELKQLSAAEREFRLAFQQDSANHVANDRLAYLLGISARSREAIPFRLKLIDLDQFKPVHLFLLCMGETALENIELLEEFHSAAPDDCAPLLGLARHEMDQQHPQKAIKLLQRVISEEPDLYEAYIRLGRILLETSSESEFVRWHHSLPHAVENYPELWGIRAMWAQQHSQTDAAIRCFWEAVRIDPNYEQANYQLGQLLIAQRRTDEAQPYLERSRLLERYFTTAKIAWTGEDMQAIRHAAELAESLGLIWEAYGWSRLTAKHDSRIRWAVDNATRLQERLIDLPLERTLATANPTTIVDLSELPLPRISRSIPTKAVASSAERKASRSHIRFIESTAEVGMSFSYFNGADSNQQTRRMYEFNGGGVAILDYDSDGWPDAYLTQGRRWPVADGQPAELDRLFRNLTGEAFDDVTVKTGLIESGFSAGGTVGDFNSDGFADVYVANLGQNCFFENNGDGTFTDITRISNTAGDAWSTSCLLADLNGDSHPDLYVVNYLEGADVFDRVCPDGTGVVRSCSPRHFSAAQDQIYFSLGDGRFENVTDRSGVMTSDGKGLGITAADFSGTGRLDLFIANDAVPNFFYSNVTTGQDVSPEFSEQAFVTGLAVNEDGRPEACMGIATGDADGDGKLDLFVTNFHNESNTLFLQNKGSQFDDATRKARLHDPSLKLLGFGTQFIDADLDGDLDLFVTNGHIDDYSESGERYRMPPQVFANDGTATFEEISSKTLGDFFQGKFLGRGAASLDWNRDGLQDVLISHLHDPAALLTNSTVDAGNYVAVRLVGVKSSRDAIGTTLTAEIQGNTLMRQLTAGDGYQASNQRLLIFGLDDARQIEVLHVRWPSGLVQHIENVPANSELLLIEGRRSATLP